MDFDDEEHEEEEEEQEHEEEEDEDDEDINLALQQPPSFDPARAIGPLSRVNPVGGNGGSAGAAAPLGTRKPGSVAPKYKECLKNHAVSIGGHAVDGCGEFMPAGEEGTLDALKCAACNCHRNFHRKENDGDHAVLPQAASAGSGGALYPQFSPYYRTPPAPPSGYLHVAAAPPPGAHHLPHRPIILPSISGGTHSRDEMEDMSHPSSSGGGGGNHIGGILKKRFRTKFTQEQKDKMLAFAETLGWRIQKQDEVAVQQFCQEAQVRRQVLKVWMHNNKHTLGKKP